MDILTDALAKLGPYGVIVAASGLIIRALWKEHVADKKANPELLSQTITALQSSRDAIDKNTAAKEENTRVGQQQIDSFNRYRESCDRQTTSLDKQSSALDRLRELIERGDRR